ncbi:MAG: hypothetical protein ACYC27_10390 [Armatimonadota bacterium]
MNNCRSTQTTKRTWIYYLAAILILAGAGAFFLHWQSSNHPYSILVDGKSAATVDSLDTAKRVLAAVRADAKDKTGSDSVRLSHQVTFKRSSDNASITDYPEAVKAIQEVASVESQMYAIIADGKAVTALPDRKSAEKTLELVKTFYEKSIKGKKGESSFKEEVHISRGYVPVEIARTTPEEAVRVLTAISEQPTIHIIERGDRAVHIARDNEVPMDILKQLNPEKNMDALTEGDQLIIKVGKRPITVVTKASLSRTTNVNPPSHEGRYSRIRTGKRVTTLIATYENGQVVSEDVLSQVTTWDRPKVSSDAYEGRRSYRRYRRSRRSSSTSSSNSQSSSTSNSVKPESSSTTE